MTLLPHPLSAIFPLLDGENLEALVADVKVNGVREPIWLLDGQILDGRNRYSAALKAGVPCPTRAYTGQDAAGFVISLNLHRRHLNETQRAMVAARLSNLAKGQRKSRNPQICVSQIDQAKAAGMLNVSTRSTQLARTVLDRATPELVAAVDRGSVAVTAAAELTSLPRSEQTAIVKRGGPEVRRAAAELREARHKPLARKPTKRDKERLQELQAAKARGVSMLTTYARLTLTALRASTPQSLTDDEKDVLSELLEAITEVSATA